MDVARFDALTRSLTGTASSRRRLITGLAGGALGGLLRLREVGEVAAARTVIASCNVTLKPSSGSGDDRYAQSFTPAVGGKLSRVVVTVRKDPGTTGDYILHILPMLDGKPDPDLTNALASAKIRNRDVRAGPERTLKFNFAKDRAATVQAGTEYAISVTRPGSTQFWWFREDANVCPAGQGFFFDTTTGQFVAMEAPETDFNFVAFVRNP